MAIQIGSGTEVLKRASTIANAAGVKMIDGVADHIYTILSISAFNAHASTTANITIYINPSAGTAVRLNNNFQIAAQNTFVWNEKTVMTGTDELVCECDVNAVHFWVSYIDQDWT